MNKNDDPNLQAPQQSNTTKHINFMEAEEADNGSNRGDDASKSEDDSPTKKALEELRNENSSNQEEATR